MPLTRRSFVPAAAASLFAQRSNRPRNLVLILSDDHRYDAMSCQGHPWIKTPNLDRLAQGGVLFENAFVTTALCSPSRASILTGQYVHSHGVLDNVTALRSDLPTFPQLLQKQGYRTALIGKWHMGGDSDDPRPGFDHWVSFRGQGLYNDPVLNINGRRDKVPGYVSDLLTSHAIDFLRANSARPFMLYLSHKAVHADFFPAERHKNLYSSEPIPYPNSYANTEENYRGKPEWVRRQRNSWHGVDGMYNQRVNFEQFYRDYARTLAGLDDSIGGVMEELKRLNLLEDTLVIYMGDNGFLFGEHGLIDKRTMYEPSIRVPMIAHCPSLFQGNRRLSGMALNLDICPTLLEAANTPAPMTVHGRSLLPLLRGQGAWRTEFLYEYFWERDYPQTPTVIGLRTDQYSYMHYHGVWDIDELYDIRQDPGQTNNLLAGYRIRNEGGRLLNRITDPEMRKRVVDFQQRINRILAETGGRMDPRWKI
jgi:N-acetylglucosamine-6-sulfatase